MATPPAAPAMMSAVPAISASAGAVSLQVGGFTFRNDWVSNRWRFHDRNREKNHVVVVSKRALSATLYIQWDYQAVPYNAASNHSNTLVCFC